MPSKTQLHPKANLVSKQNSERTSPQAFNEATVQSDFAMAIQQARVAPNSLTPRNVLQFQRIVGNRAVSRLVTEHKQGLAASAPIVTNTHVAQRSLITKEDIFLDQVKMQVVKGIASLQVGKTKSEDHEKFVVVLNKNNIINLATLKIGNKSQTAFFQQERNSGLAQVTLKNLQDKGLLMEAVKLVDLGSAWEEYKTDIKPSSEAEGLGGQAENDNRAIKTRIKWENVHGVTGEGTKVTALILGPDHPLGSTPTDKTKVQSKTLTQATKQPYIAGHLLNDHLGGPGNEPRNITALPKDVNTEQSDKIEEKVKQKVNADHEIVFYQVEVTYAQDSKPVNGKQHHYAKELKSTFGSYKEDADFSKVSFNTVPDSELKDRYDHTLPIEAPSEYTSSQSGYKQGIGNTYGTGASRDATEKLNKIPKPMAAKLKIEGSKDVLLKDPKQVKLEFISFAIYSLPIRDLKTKIEELEKWTQTQDKLLGEGAQEITRLEEELQKSEALLKKLSQDFKQVSQDYEKELADKESAQQRNKELEETLGKVQQELQGSTREVIRLTEEVKQLTQKLEQATAQKRDRAEQMGRLAAKAKEPKEPFVREMSPESTGRFNLGYASTQQSQREEEEVQRAREREQGFLNGQQAGKAYAYEHGYKDGCKRYRMDIEYHLQQARQMMGIFFVGTSGDYQTAYQTAFEQTFAAIYSEVYKEWRAKADIAYHDGYNAGYYRTGYRPPDNRDLVRAYDRGYNQGIYDLGFNHGKRDAERNLVKRNASQNQDYQAGYDEGYAKYSRPSGQPAQKQHKY